MNETLEGNKHGKNTPRVLLVDDESDIRMIIQKGLSNEGFQVDVSGDPVEIAATYKAGMYDLVLLDIRMPGMSGFDLYRKILAVDKKVKVCFVTAFEIYYDEFRKVFPKLRVNCFVRKPVTISHLAQIIREELARESLDQMEEAPQSSQKSVHKQIMERG